MDIAAVRAPNLVAGDTFEDHGINKKLLPNSARDEWIVIAGDQIDGLIKAGKQVGDVGYQLLIDAVIFEK